MRGVCQLHRFLTRLMVSLTICISHRFNFLPLINLRFLAGETLIESPRKWRHSGRSLLLTADTQSSINE